MLTLALIFPSCLTLQAQPFDWKAATRLNAVMIRSVQSQLQWQLLRQKSRGLSRVLEVVPLPERRGKAPLEQWTVEGLEGNLCHFQVRTEVRPRPTGLQTLGQLGQFRAPDLQSQQEAWVTDLPTLPLSPRATCAP
jgi:hypothetical protein